VPDPTFQAAGAIVQDHLATIRDVVVGADARRLNARPAGPDSNPAAVLVMHAAASTRHWLHVAAGVPPPPRDRDAEFRTVVEGPDELLAFVDEVATDVASLVASAGPFEPAAHREAEDVTAAWALVHAVEHLAEHVGHLGLTRDLWAAPPA
jgi:hypothetical protein